MFSQQVAARIHIARSSGDITGANNRVDSMIL